MPSAASEQVACLSAISANQAMDFSMQPALIVAQSVAVLHASSGTINFSALLATQDWSSILPKCDAYHARFQIATIVRSAVGAISHVQAA